MERVCVCAKTNKTALKFTNQAAVLAERKNHYQTITNTNHGNSASEVAQWLNEIYPSNRAIWKTHGYHHHFSRLFEELGEVYEAYCSHITRGSTDLTAISEELADCVAWLLSAWDIQYPNTAFIDEFINYYTENCPVCSKAPCECADHYARNKSLHTERDLEKLLSSLNKLAEAISSESSNTPTVDEAIKLIQTAANDINDSKKTQSTADIKQVVNRSENLINSARRALAKSPEISEKFNALFDAYENIKNALPWT